MANKPKYTQQQMIQALRDTKGMVYLAADRLGCEAKTVYNYRDRYPAIAAEIDHQDGLLNDVAELKLVKAIQNGEKWAIMFRLRTKGKDRGYGDSQALEVSGPNGDAVNIRLTWGDNDDSDGSTPTIA